MKEKHDNTKQRYKESKVAVKVFDKLSKLWFLDETQQHSLVGQLVEPLTDEQLLAITMLANIKYSLTTLFGDSKMKSPWNDAEVLRADNWIFCPNKTKGFQGLSALDLMLTEGFSGIKFVNDYLLAQLN